MNVSDQITEVALKFPYKRSVVFGKVHSNKPVKYEHYTFIQLEKRINQFANYFIEAGINRGDRVLVFVKPSLDFSAIVFALFKMGAVAVLIDPGMGVKKLMGAITDVKPRFLIGIPLVHYLRKIYKKEFSSIKKFLSLGRVLDFSSHNILKDISLMNYDFASVEVSHDDLAAILFTSGGTGKPKGVLYQHRIFVEQTKMLQKAYSLTSDDVDMPGFPLFGLFTLSMGMTSVIPDLNPSKPKTAKARKLVQMINEQGVTFAAGSPAIWQNVADFCLKEHLTLPSIKYLVMFGAPIDFKLHEKFSKVLTHGDTYTPYGATECLPVTNIKGKEILDHFKDLTKSGLGVCVGKPVSDVEIKILNENGVGDVIVHSKTMTSGYFEDEVKTKESKVELDGKTWHKMGDVGHLDSEGNLWFCGRRAHVVNFEEHEYFPICVEAIFNQHPDVKRSALVDLQSGPGIVIERWDAKDNLSKKDYVKFTSEIFALADKHPHTRKISTLLLHKNFPVDVRHNIKIDRKKLSTWAREKLA